MITKMTEVGIFGPKTLLEGVTELLQDLGTVHIERPPARRGLGFLPFETDGHEARKLVELETLLERLEKSLLLLPERSGGSPPDDDGDAFDPSDDSFTARMADLLGEAEEHHLRLKPGIGTHS